MKKDDTIYLKHILDAIKRIEKYLPADMNPQLFNKTPLIQDGVIRQIEIIGEAAKGLSEKIKGRHPEIPWKDIVGMRNKLIHDYFGVDMDAVFDTVKKNIPDLKKGIKTILILEEV